ncbi:MAG: F0F1 ATP synthase subunit delta [Candidatus Dormiibacterota bacterium]|jgi:F-type H+-transporting ATPase subunit delta
MASALARRYAEACYDVARERVGVEPIGADLERAREILGDPRVRAVMANPRVTIVERNGALTGLLAGLAAPARNLVMLLVSHGRFRLLDEVVEEYRHLVDEASGVLRIVVRSAVPLDRTASRRVEGVLAVRFGRAVRIEAVHDPEIIGGLVVGIGDRVIDDSVRSHLQQLQAATA